MLLFGPTGGHTLMFQSGLLEVNAHSRVASDCRLFIEVLPTLLCKAKLQMFHNISFDRHSHYQYIVINRAVQNHNTKKISSQVQVIASFWYWISLVTMIKRWSWILANLFIIDLHFTMCLILYNGIKNPQSSLSRRPSLLLYPCCCISATSSSGGCICTAPPLRLWRHRRDHIPNTNTNREEQFVWRFFHSHLQSCPGRHHPSSSHLFPPLSPAQLFLPAKSCQAGCGPAPRYTNCCTPGPGINVPAVKRMVKQCSCSPAAAQCPSSQSYLWLWPNHLEIFQPHSISLPI